MSSSLLACVCSTRREAEMSSSLLACVCSTRRDAEMSSSLLALGEMSSPSTCEEGGERGWVGGVASAGGKGRCGRHCGRGCGRRCGRRCGRGCGRRCGRGCGRGDLGDDVERGTARKQRRRLRAWQDGSEQAPDADALLDLAGRWGAIGSRQKPSAVIRSHRKSSEVIGRQLRSNHKHKQAQAITSNHKQSQAIKHSATSLHLSHSPPSCAARRRGSADGEIAPSPAWTQT